MFSHKDIDCRTVFVINCIRKRGLRVCNGELLLEEQVENSDKTKTLTKLPFQKILALFVIGNIQITTPLIEKCKRFGVALVVMKASFRPVFYWANDAEANFILHKRQYAFDSEDISVAKILMENKLINQRKALLDTRSKDELTLKAIDTIDRSLSSIQEVSDYSSLLGIEGNAAKIYFSAFFQGESWKQRQTRTKCDAINATLDIGYYMLFNFIECYLRMFGFDIYIGVYHRTWFKRKSLVCDIMEPFRPIIDKAVRTGWHRKQFSEKDFHIQKGEYRLKHEKNSDYCHVFFDALIPYKSDTFKYVQSYYRCFMGCKSVKFYPSFLL